MIKKKKSIQNATASKRNTIVQESFMKSFLSIMDNITVWWCMLTT
ncbi:hypothetical protein [Bacillus cereus]